ncbi:MAG: hypothetical protein ACD_67C00203G0001 [uncultured bacterium]|nr:MAG: hypothetical protein ACD_67C00203G0001 [uncultured bacterium]
MKEKMRKITEKIFTIKDSGAELEREVREKTLGYIITSFGLVAGLAWNDAIKAFIERFFSEPGDGLKAKFLYAAILTVAVVAVSLYLLRLFKVEKKKKKEVVVEKVVAEETSAKKK